MSDGGSIPGHRLHDAARVVHIPSCGMRTPRVRAASAPHDLKASATSRFIWGALVPVATARVVALRAGDGRRDD